MEPQRDGDAIVTADLFDRYPALLNVCEVQFRSFGARRGFYGPCATLKFFEDQTAGFANVPVTFGNCTFEPGDWVNADVDAVTVSNLKLALDGV